MQGHSKGHRILSASSYFTYSNVMESGYSKHSYKAWFILVPVLVVTMIVSQIILKIITKRQQHMTQVKENGDHRSMY
jgi:competence protein ComGC